MKIIQIAAIKAMTPTTVYFSVPSNVNMSRGGAYGVRNNSNISHRIVATASVPPKSSRFHGLCFESSFCFVVELATAIDGK